MAFQHAEFCAYATFFCWEACTPTHWKPALSVMEQNSSHLQDFSSAFRIKDGFK